MNWAFGQYRLVVETRSVIFRFCDTLSQDHYVRKVDHFGQGSIRQTQAHIADAYIHWIANYALGKSLPYFKAESIESVSAMRKVYASVDILMEEFMKTYAEDSLAQLTNTIPRRGKVRTTPLAVFTHMITHEFHHKGQMMSMARILGYEPPDTDIIRL